MIHHSQQLYFTQENISLGNIMYVISHHLPTLWTHDVTWTHIRGSEDVREVFWTFVMYVKFNLCPLSRGSVFLIFSQQVLTAIIFHVRKYKFRQYHVWNLPLDTWRLLNVFCTFNLRPVSRGSGSLIILDFVIWSLEIRYEYIHYIEANMI